MVVRIHGCADSWLHGFMVARIHGCADSWLCGFMVVRIHGCADSWLCGFMVVRIHGCTNEYTGLHPVLGYFAPSGLGGLVYNADNLDINPQKFVHSWLPFLTRF